MMVGRLLSFRDRKFSGTIWNFQEEIVFIETKTSQGSQSTKSRHVKSIGWMFASVTQDLWRCGVRNSLTCGMLGGHYNFYCNPSQCSSLSPIFVHLRYMSICPSQFIPDVLSENRRGQHLNQVWYPTEIHDPWICPLLSFLMSWESKGYPSKCCLSSKNKALLFSGGGYIIPGIGMGTLRFPELW